METRTLAIRHGHSGPLQAILMPDTWYRGPYLEHYEQDEALMSYWRAKGREWTEARIGLVYDIVKDRVAAFRQLVKSRDDARPWGVALSRDGSVVEAISDGVSTSENPCRVCDFTERTPTEEEQCAIAKILASLPDKGTPPVPARKRGRKRGAPKQYMLSALKKLEAAIAANNGSLIDTAKHQAPSDWKNRLKAIRLMHDDARKHGLTPKQKKAVKGR